MNTLDLLQSRRSISNLVEPAPHGEALEQMFKAALRAPDHGGLRPWHFVVVEGDAREHLGEILYGVSGEEKYSTAPLRAPMVIIAVARICVHPKVPEIEQLLSAGCAVQNLLNAAYALGYGAIWRTGPVTYNANLAPALGLLNTDKVIGFIYIGTPDGKPKALPELDPSDFVSELVREE